LGADLKGIKDLTDEWVVGKENFYFERGKRPMKAQLDEESIVKANSQFWEQMLAMKLEAKPAGVEFYGEGGHISGIVLLAGAWKGEIEVRMAGGLAYEATAAMMMQPLDLVSAADVLDAAAEIANMVAGTIKSSLPRPCSMSVPQSSAEGKCGESAHEDDLLTMVFRHEAGDLMVRVWEQECIELECVN
jgi:CheY-specific phosphatase CheX